MFLQVKKGGSMKDNVWLVLIIIFIILALAGVITIGR